MNPFAEIIESSLDKWKVQAWNLENNVIFGSLVKVKSKDRTIFGLVSNIEICSIDPHRIITAYKKEEIELKRDQPQIFEFLKANFNCITVGYKDDISNVLLYQLAPEPPKIHAFVYLATDEEVIDFFTDEQYLTLLFNFSNSLLSLEELLLAILKQLSDRNVLKKDNLEKFIELFSLLTANDYRRLKLFLKRTKPILKNL